MKIFYKRGNFSEVPSMDVLKTAKQQYIKKYRCDEDYFKELRVLGFLKRLIDHTSKDVIGESFSIRQIINTFE